MPLVCKVYPVLHEVQLYSGPHILHPVKQGKHVWFIFVNPEGHVVIQKPWYWIKDDKHWLQFVALVQLKQFTGQDIQVFVEIWR
jgi:hypothetical protein